jgi:serine/threonine protein kinase
VNTERRKRFKNEIGFCSKAQHPNIIRVQDWGWAEWDQKKCPFYVMPRYPLTLRNLIDDKLRPVEVLRLFSQILDGVEAAHLLGVIHRDLKPENILVTQSKESLVIADFGIAHFEEDIIATPMKTPAAAKMANLSYSAPEQRTKGTLVNYRADIFALGLILNEMFTGSVPHGVGYLTIGQVAAELSYLDALVEKMIQHRVEMRYLSIEEIKKELIGRRLEFVSFQELNKKKTEIVPATTPPTFDPIRLEEIDWHQGRLIIRLNRTPEARWVYIFHNPIGNYTSILGAGPSDFDFQEDKAMLLAEERAVQQIIDHFKDYVDMTNRTYREELVILVRNWEQEQRQRLELQIDEAERRARILKSVKL